MSMPIKGRSAPTLIRNEKSKLQNKDMIVNSIKDCRKAYSNLNNHEFALWYEKHFKVPYKRVKAILLVLEDESGGAA